MAEIKGQVRVANGLVAKGLTFQLFRERFGADPEVVATVTTDDDGQFSVPDVDADERTTLVAKMQRPGADDVVLAPLDDRAGPDVDATRRRAARDASFESEFQRLSDAIAPVLGGASLATAEESATRAAT